MNERMRRPRAQAQTVEAASADPAEPLGHQAAEGLDYRDFGEIHVPEELREQLHELQRTEAYQNMERYAPTSYALVGDLRLDELEERAGHAAVSGTGQLAREMCIFECDHGPHTVPVTHVHGTALKPDGSLVLTAGETPSQLVDSELTPNLVYFLHAYCFHPDIPPTENLSTASIANNPGRSAGNGRVMTIDTGHSPRVGYTGRRAPVYANSSHPPIDNWPIVDALTGHGPAIADLIEQRLDGNRSFLTQVDYASGLGVGYSVEAPGKNGTKHLVRGFSGHSLGCTLDVALSPSHQPPFTVLNLSLGAVACPRSMTNDPVHRKLSDWLQADQHRFVTVAAGNHGNCVPSWPAAYCDNWPSYKMAATQRLHGVGSGTSPQDHDDFSADGEWVSEWRPGANVPVAHHKHAQTMWSGTSFAAPMLAADLAI